MDHLAREEQKKYTLLWNAISSYGDFSPAEYLTRAFLIFFKGHIHKGESVTDFGCGTGRSATFLSQAHLRVQLVDFCDNCIDIDIFLQSVRPYAPIQFFQECLWDLSDSVQPTEWIICFDVLEHIPEQKIHNVLHAMASRMKRGGLLNISLREDVFGSYIGQVLHVTVKSASWWRKKVRRYFSIVNEVDCGKMLVLAVEPLLHLS